MTIDQFRSNDYLPGQWAKELATNGILQKVMEVMEENHPARHALTGDANDDVSPTRAAIELGVTRGYSRYGDTLRFMAVRKTKHKNVGEPTYEKPPQEEVK